MLREESQRQFSPSNSQSGHAHPVHPSSQSRSCASPPSTENLGPYWNPLLMLQPHLPPAGCRPQAQEWSWELAQNGDSMGGALSIPETLFPNPSLGRGSWAVLGVLLLICPSSVSATVSLYPSPPCAFTRTTLPLPLPLPLLFFHIPAPLYPLLFSPCASGHTSERL